MAHEVSIQEAALTLPALIEEVRQGGEVVLCENHKPLVRLVAATLQPKDDAALKDEAQIRFIKSLRGKYAHLRGSSDDFAARKQEEKELEG